MSKRKCVRCRMPAPKPEHLYQRGDGKRFCMPCILILAEQADIVQANALSDAAMSEHLRHFQRFAGCPLCAVEV